MGVLGGIGLAVLAFGFHLEPTSPPIDVVSFLPNRLPARSPYKYRLTGTARQALKRIVLLSKLEKSESNRFSIKSAVLLKKEVKLSET